MSLFWYDGRMDKTYLDKLALIEIQHRKLLMTLSKGKDAWYIPGGKREQGESDFDALAREVKEELGVEVLPGSAELYGVFEAQAHGKPEGTFVRMTCYRAKFTGILTPSSEIERIDWFRFERKGESSLVDHLIFDDLKAKDLID